jgi:electron transfer flavoprotein alpha subunit
MNEIWVFTEETMEGPATIGLELLTKARDLAPSVACFYLGAGSPESFATLGAHGATTVYHLAPGSNELPTAAAAAAMADLVGVDPPDVVMFGMTYTDRDVAGRLSARLEKPIISNAVDVAVSGGEVHVVNEVFGGATLVETAFRSQTPYLVVVRPKSFTAEPGTPQTPEVRSVKAPDVGRSGAAEVVERHLESKEGPQLEEAAVIVSGGRGLGAPEHYQLIEGVAQPLGAATGATRAIVDAGWVPYSKQVGQTGKTVKPDVYIACGISGAMQHLVGMKDSKVIIAVNKDPEAPIFAVADLGIVGDVHNVLPKLIEELQKRV